MPKSTRKREAKSAGSDMVPLDPVVAVIRVPAAVVKLILIID
jgi:hypothetical protein